MARATKSGWSVAGSVSMVEPKMLAAATTACAISGPRRHRRGALGAGVGGSPRRNRSMVPGGHLSTASSFALVDSRGQLRPLLERHQGAGVDDASAARLRWLTLACAGARRGGAGAHHPGVIARAGLDHA